MADVTHILSEMERGNPQAADQLWAVVYNELRKLATAKLSQEKPGQTLQATALVNEAYMRLVGAESSPKWNSRGHFFAAAAEAMRRILIDRARNKKRIKRAGEKRNLDLDAIAVAMDTPADDLLALDEALQTLRSQKEEVAELVKLRFFAGMTLDDAATALGISRRTAYRQWAFARAWLYQHLCENVDPTSLGKRDAVTRLGDNEDRA
jgi:RNA polymerase sigma factor (TIGR02999 family)